MQTRTKATIGLTLAAIAMAANMGPDPGSNDEMDQASSLYAYLDGSTHVTERPTAIYSSSYEGHLVQHQPRYNHTAPVGSHLLNLLAYPTAKALSFAIPAPEAAMVALRATNLALYAATVWLLWAPIRRRCTTDGAAVAVLLAVSLGPLMFWGQAMKYHALTAFLAAAVLNLADRDETPRFLLGLTAGLSVFAHPGAGAVIIPALIAGEAWRVRRLPIKAIAGRWWPMALGGLLGTLPWLAATWYYHSGNDPYAQAAVAGTGDGAAPWLTLPLNLASGYILSRAEGNPVPVLWLSPLLAAAVLAWQRPSRLTALCVAAVVAHAVVYANRGPWQGFGADMRFYAVLLPFLGILAADGVGHRIPAKAPLAGAAALAGLVMAVVVSEALGGDLQGRGYHMTLAALTLSTLGALWAIHRLGWSQWNPAAALHGACVALPALWGLIQADAVNIDATPWRHYA